MLLDYVLYNIINRCSHSAVSDHVAGVTRIELAGLKPNTLYVARVTGYNSAGATVKDFTFSTTQHDSGNMPGTRTK